MENIFDIIIIKNRSQWLLNFGRKILPRIFYKTMMFDGYPIRIPKWMTIKEYDEWQERYEKIKDLKFK